MKVKRYLLSAEDIQELIDVARKGERLYAIDRLDDETREEYLEVSGEITMRTYYFGDELEIDEINTAEEFTHYESEVDALRECEMLYEDGMWC